MHLCSVRPSDTHRSCYAILFPIGRRDFVQEAIGAMFSIRFVKMQRTLARFLKKECSLLIVSLCSPDLRHERNIVIFQLSQFVSVGVLRPILIPRSRQLFDDVWTRASRAAL